MRGNLKTDSRTGASGCSLSRRWTEPCQLEREARRSFELCWRVVYWEFITLGGFHELWSEFTQSGWTEQLQANNLIASGSGSEVPPEAGRQKPSLSEKIHFDSWLHKFPKIKFEGKVPHLESKITNQGPRVKINRETAELKRLTRLSDTE